MVRGAGESLSSPFMVTLAHEILTGIPRASAAGLPDTCGAYAAIEWRGLDRIV